MLLRLISLWYLLASFLLLLMFCSFIGVIFYFLIAFWWYCFNKFFYFILNFIFFCDSIFIFYCIYERFVSGLILSYILTESTLNLRISSFLLRLYTGSIWSFILWDRNLQRSLGPKKNWKFENDKKKIINFNHMK